jgi:hypothetical protein
LKFFGGQHSWENVRWISWHVADISDWLYEETWSNTNSLEAGSWGLKGKPWMCSNFNVIVRLPKLATGERNIFSSTERSQPSQRGDVVWNSPLTTDSRFKGKSLQLTSYQQLVQLN